MAWTRRWNAGEVWGAALYSPKQLPRPEDMSAVAAPPPTDWRALPKVLLHEHLDGGLRPQTLLELADQGYRGCKAVWLQQV